MGGILHPLREEDDSQSPGPDASAAEDPFAFVRKVLEKVLRKLEARLVHVVRKDFPVLYEIKSELRASNLKWDGDGYA